MCYSKIFTACLPSLNYLLIAVFPVFLPQRWSQEALSSSSSWPSTTTAKLSSNPWSKFSCFSAKKDFGCCMCFKNSSQQPHCSSGWTTFSSLHHYLAGVHSRQEKNNLWSIEFKVERFSIKHQRCSFLPRPTSFSHPNTYSFSSQHQSHFLILLSGDIKLLSFQHNLDIWLKASIILLCQTQALSRHFTSPGCQMTPRVFFRGRVGRPPPSGNTGCVGLWLTHLINFCCFHNVTTASVLNVTV